VADNQRASKKLLDFTKVKDQGEFNPVHQEAGDYVMQITGVTESKSKADNDMWTFVCKDVNRARATYPYRCTLNLDALWKVRNLFVACGIQVPKKKFNVDPNKLVGKQFGCSLEDEEYEGRMKSVIAAVFPASDVVAPTKTKKKKVEEVDEDEDIEDEDVPDEIEDVDDLDEL